MALFLARRDRALTRDIQINGTLNGVAVVITPASSDKIRAILRAIATDYLTITNDASTPAGSSFSKNDPTPGKNRLHFAAADLGAMKAGVYTLIIDYLDGSGEWQTCDRQIFCLE